MTGQCNRRPSKEGVLCPGLHCLLKAYCKDAKRKDDLFLLQGRVCSVFSGVAYSVPQMG